MIKGSGGTSGGLGSFFGGIIMAGAGFYMISRKVMIHSGFASHFYGIPFGVTLLPLIVGIGFLFFHSRSKIGWVLTAGGFVFVLVEIILSLRMAIVPFNLYEGLVMFVLLAGGLGLVFRSFRAR